MDEEKVKHFQTQKFDLDVVHNCTIFLTLMAPALPNPRVVPHISADHFAEHVAFIWHLFAMYLTFLLLIFLLFFVHIAISMRGLHLLNVCLIFLTHFIFLLSYLNFVPSMVKQSLEVSRNNPWVINIQLQSSCAMKK